MCYTSTEQHFQAELFQIVKDSLRVDLERGFHDAKTSIYTISDQALQSSLEVLFRVSLSNEIKEVNVHLPDIERMVYEPRRRSG